MAHELGEKCFFITLTNRYDPEKQQSDQDYSLKDLTLFVEYFITILRRGGGKRGNAFFGKGEEGFEFEYSRNAEWTEAGIVNHFHMLFRVRKAPQKWLVKTRQGQGLDFYRLRAVWEHASHGSMGVFIKPVSVASVQARASAVAYLTKYVSKRTAGSEMRFSTSRNWLPPGAMKKYDEYFSMYSIKYLADCNNFHTDASKVWAPWAKWLVLNKDERRPKQVRRRRPVEVPEIIRPKRESKIKEEADNWFYSIYVLPLLKGQDL